MQEYLRELKMVQNRNKLIELFIGNIANTIVHEILERAVSGEMMADRYRKELITSFEIAKRYREKINPVNGPLPDKDIAYIKEKIIARVKAELTARISRGYSNIGLELVESLTDKALSDAKIKL